MDSGDPAATPRMLRHIVVLTVPLPIVSEEQLQIRLPHVTYYSKKQHIANLTQFKPWPFFHNTA